MSKFVVFPNSFIQPELLEIKPFAVSLSKLRPETWMTKVQMIKCIKNSATRKNSNLLNQTNHFFLNFTSLSLSIIQRTVFSVPHIAKGIAKVRKKFKPANISQKFFTKNRNYITVINALSTVGKCRSAKPLDDFPAIPAAEHCQGFSCVKDP